MTDPIAPAAPTAPTAPVDSFPPPPPLPEAAIRTPSVTASVTPPRTRWAGIVWGVFFAAIAAVALWILSDATRRTSAVEWAFSLDGATGIAMGVLAIGVILLVAGLSGILRRAQRHWGEHGAARDDR